MLPRIVYRCIINISLLARCIAIMLKTGRVTANLAFLVSRVASPWGYGGSESEVVCVHVNGPFPCKSKYAWYVKLLQVIDFGITSGGLLCQQDVCFMENF